MRLFALLATYGLSSVSTFGCTARESGDVSILARPISASNEATPALQRTICEHLPTDLPAAKPPYPDSVTWSSNGALVAAAIGQSGEASSRVDGAQGIVVWSASNGEVLKRWRIPVQSVRFAHAGDRLAYASVWESGVIDLKIDCAQRWHRRGPLVTWSADDRSLFLAGFDRLAAIDPTNGALLHERPAGEESPRLVAIDASTTRLAVQDELHNVRTLGTDLSLVADLPNEPNAIGNARAVAISPDGSLVASARIENVPVKVPPNTMPGSPFTQRFFVRIVSVADGRLKSVFPGDPEALAFSPDGMSLAIAESLESRLLVRNVTTGETKVLDKKVYFPQRLAWSPDGRSVALADWRGAIRIYDVEHAASPPRILVP